MAIDDTDGAPEQRVDLQDALHERPDAARRIGMGLQALYNFALLERMPSIFADLLRRLEQAEQAARAGEDPERRDPVNGVRG
ncbi:MAG: hypothetical protein U1E62_15545 [Alsobacter sp.]